MGDLLTGIQQVGIGVRDVDASFYWAHRMFDFDIPVFDDEAEAKLMTRYTGGDVHSRRALLALTLRVVVDLKSGPSKVVRVNPLPLHLNWVILGLMKSV